MPNCNIIVSACIVYSCTKAKGKKPLILSNNYIILILNGSAIISFFIYGVSEPTSIYNGFCESQWLFMFKSDWFI